MKLMSVSNVSFKSNYYKVSKYGASTTVDIMTDNAENLGLKPVCESKYDSCNMLYDGKFYTTELPMTSCEYRIKYEDTGKYENNGIKKIFDYDILCKLINKIDKPKDRVLLKGCAKGLLVQAKNVNQNLLNSNIPLIIICDNQDDCYKYFGQAEGMILKSASDEVLSHFAAGFRNYFNFGHLVINKKILQNLNKLEGNFISISNENEALKYCKINPIARTSVCDGKIIIPKMENVDKILTLEECTKDNVGNKAYNLKRMQNLVIEGKLTDVIIPNAFVLPHVYLERVQNAIKENTKNRWNQNEPTLVEIKEFAKNIITQDSVIVRSAFNGEDLDGYSAAGLYDSFYSSFKDLRLGIIDDVINSKNKSVALKSRIRHGIKNNDIKPSVIIQDFISADYSFTVYTQSPFDKNKLMLELFINENRHCNPEPYQIMYDRTTGNMTVEKEHSVLTEYIFDEKYNLLNINKVKDVALDKMLPVLKKLVNNALVLEKEFAKPQDIEGGIKDGQLYFWQSRNIVNK